MRVAFDVHNEFGRLLDEELYKRELAIRCLAMGIKPVEREVRIRAPEAKENRIMRDRIMDEPW